MFSKSLIQRLSSLRANGSRGQPFSFFKNRLLTKVDVLNTFYKKLSRFFENADETSTYLREKADLEAFLRNLLTKRQHSKRKRASFRKNFDDMHTFSRRTSQKLKITCLLQVRKKRPEKRDFSAALFQDAFSNFFPPATIKPSTSPQPFPNPADSRHKTPQTPRTGRLPHRISFHRSAF